MEKGSCKVIHTISEFLLWYIFSHPKCAVDCWVFKYQKYFDAADAW